MSQHIRSGGTFVGTWWSSEANQAFQPLEAEFDAPSQAIKSKHISRSEVRRCERGHEDNPVCGGERSFRDLIAFPLSVPARLASRGRSSLRRLLDGNQTQSKSSAALASDPDRPIDAPACRCVAQLGNKIKRITLGIEPARALPASTDEEVSPGVEDDCHAIGLQIGTIANADLALDHRYPVERLARLLIGQLEIVKAFARKIERAMNAPQPSTILAPMRPRGDALLSLIQLTPMPRLMVRPPERRQCRCFAWHRPRRDLGARDHRPQKRSNI